MTKQEKDAAEVVNLLIKTEDPIIAANELGEQKF